MSTNHPTNATLEPPPATPRRRVLADLTPLRSSADYRRVWFGQSVSSIGQQMTAVAVAVQVYALTGSAFATGVVGLCSLIPLVGFGLYGGAVADRVDRRKLGLIGSAGLAAVSAVLSAQALLGLHQVGVLYAAVALQGGFFAISGPARSAMIPACCRRSSCPPPMPSTRSA